MEVRNQMGDFLSYDKEEILLPKLLVGAVLGDILRLQTQLNTTRDKKASIMEGSQTVLNRSCNRNSSPEPVI